jgi:ADP-ribose pyrophosphatase YjhB (NUDIX family)
MEHKRVFTQTFGVVGAIIERDGKILMVKEAKERAKNQWNHPAGWIDLGENPLDSVKREVKDETGYDFEPEQILGVYSLYKLNLKEKFNIAPHPIKIIFTGKISENATGKLEDDVSETKWFSPEEIYKMDKKSLRDIDIKQMIKDYFAGKAYPLELLTHTLSE